MAPSLFTPASPPISSVLPVLSVVKQTRRALPEVSNFRVWDTVGMGSRVRPARTQANPGLGDGIPSGFPGRLDSHPVVAEWSPGGEGERQGGSGGVEMPQTA